MKTKKVLAPFDLNNPRKKIKGFLCPNIDEEGVNSFLEIDTNKEWNIGRVAFIGMEISKNDVFARIVDSGKKIKSVDGLLNTIEDYIEQISNFKIGDVVGIKSLENGNFELIKLQKPPRRVNRKLP